MASPTRTLTVNFVGRTKNLERSFKRVSKGSATMSDNLMRATRMAGIGFGALAGVAVGAAMALKPMIDKAAAMEEALSKNRLLLGESSKAVEAFADTSLESFGVTNLAALQATGVFASLGDAMGMSEEASASMATTLTGLAGDLSSLHDVSVETALTALRAGLIGEAEPLRKLGILLDAATIKAKALEMGLVKNTKEALTPAIKSQAAYALILEKGATAMGDFARTSDSATNATKKLAGGWVELQVKIGEAILPFYTDMINHLVDVILPAVTDFWEDPSWERGALLAGQAAQNGFVKGFVGFGLAVAGAILDPVSLVFAAVKDLATTSGEEAGEEAGEKLAVAMAAVITQFGRDNPDWYRGDWDPEASGTTDGLAYGAGFAFAVSDADAAMRREMQEALEAFTPGGGDGGAAAAAAPADFLTAVAALEEAAAAADAATAALAAEPFAVLSQAEIDSMVANAAEAAVTAALEAVAAAAPAAAVVAPAAAVVAPAAAEAAAEAAAVVAPAAVGPAGLDEFLKVVGTSDWAKFLGGITPTATEVTTNNQFNITGVSPSEVMDAIGAAVDLTGPMPPHWQQSAN